MAPRASKYQQKPPEYNPFEAKIDHTKLRAQLDMIDNKDLRVKFKVTQKDSITYAFEALEQDSIKNLAFDFVKEGFMDMVSFITHIMD